MLGVLLASDEATQQTHVLKAFSGQVSASSGCVKRFVPSACLTAPRRR